MFAPRIKWEALESTVEDVKEAAEKYENAFNDIISSVTDTENFQQVYDPASHIPMGLCHARYHKIPVISPPAYNRGTQGEENRKSASNAVLCFLISFYGLLKGYLCELTLFDLFACGS